MSSQDPRNKTQSTHTSSGEESQVIAAVAGGLQAPAVEMIEQAGEQARNSGFELGRQAQPYLTQKFAAGLIEGLQEGGSQDFFKGFAINIPVIQLPQIDLSSAIAKLKGANARRISAGKKPV